MAKPAQGKTAIVTGGASGIGLGVTEYLASQGYSVAVFDVNIDSGNAVVSKLSVDNPKAKFVFKECDVSSWHNLAQAFKEVYTEFGNIDFVLANAGIGEQSHSGVIASFRDDEPQQPNIKVIDIDLVGVIFSVKLATHYLNKNPDTGGSRGLILCTASIAALYPFESQPLYGAAKAGVVGLVRSAAGQLKSHKIRINALAPAVLETNIAPDKAVFQQMIVTPMSTLVNGVAKFIEDLSLTGEVAEIHGQNVTFRPPHEVVDEDTKTNLGVFAALGELMRNT